MRSAPGLALASLTLAAFAGFAAPRAAFAQSSPEGSPPLRLVQSIDLPGVKGRIDHMDVDLRGMRLFVAAVDNGSLEIVDLAGGRRIRSLPGLGGPQGVAFVPEAKAVFVSERDAGDLLELDSESFETLRRLSFGGDADNLHYLTDSKELILGYGQGGVAVIDALEAVVKAKADLAGHPEGLQGEEEGDYVYVNVPAVDKIYELSRLDMSILDSWDSSGLLSNFSMALDEPGHRIAYYTHVPSRITLFDTLDGAPFDQEEAPKDVDDLFFSAKGDELYLVSGSGYVERWSVDREGAMKKQSEAATGPGARTGLYVPELRRLYVAAPAAAGQGARILVFE